MGIRVKFGVLIFSAIIALYAIVGGLLPRYGVVVSNDPYSQMTIFHEVLSRIVEDYVDEPDLEKVRRGALRGLAEGLDPYSAYLTPEQVRRYRAAGDTARGESGMVLSKLAGYAYVVSVIKGGPADLAGVRAGDVIEYLDDRATRDMSLYEALEMVHGEVGKEVVMKLFRRPKKVKFALADVNPPAPTGRLMGPGVGYLHALSLVPASVAKLRTELQTLVNRGAEKLVLDLRGAADGEIEQGVAVANLFIPRGRLAKVVGKDGKEVRTYEATPAKRVFKGPLVVLMDRSTAGAAEVVASAVLERHRGEAVGERTFGAGGDQELFRLRDGGGLLMTTRKYASPSGKPFMGATSATSGVMPSVEVRPADRAALPSPEELRQAGAQPAEEGIVPPPAKSGEDLQLKKALELLRQGKK